MQVGKYEIGANLQGLEFRKQANEILAALASSNAGDLEPSSAQAGTVWLDTSNDKKHLLKIRNKANNVWGILCSIDVQSGAVDAIDAYNKKESDDKFALKDELPTQATQDKAGITKLKNSVTGNSEDTAVSEKAVKEFASGVIQKQENGYQKLPSGLIFQWGAYPTITAGQSKDVNLPVAFPTAGVFCSANDSSDAGNLAVMLCKFKSNSQITVTNDHSTTTGSRNVSGQWFAVGY